MAAALIDRLLRHCHIVNTRGNSYRLKEHQELLRRRLPQARKESGGEERSDDPHGPGRPPLAPLAAAAPDRAGAAAWPSDQRPGEH